jgi:protein SCO1/2
MAKKIKQFSIYWILSAGLLLVALLIVFLLSSSDMRSRGTGGEDGQLGGNFTLSSVNGDISLSDYKGKIVLLYFGFVNCSQVCPISMGIMQQTIEKMAAEEVEQIQVLLISVDIDNDNADIVDQYAKRFNQDFIGLTGTLDEINHVVDEYGSYYSPTELKDIDEGRAFRHSSRFYVINRQGELVDAMRHSTTSNELKARLRSLI